MADTTEPGAAPFDIWAGTPFRSVRVLAEGGMGLVYEVEHLRLGKHFAAKVVHQEFAGDAALLDRMRVEAQTLARLEHPNIVAVTTVGKLGDERPYFVMELLQGRTLGTELRARGRLPILEAIGRTRELLSALSAVHSLGVVHRDVKLENLFLHAAPGAPRAVLKVLDFGIAKILADVHARTPAPPVIPTEEGAFIGTARFVSPEGARGAVVDVRADVYSTGVVLYALLVGKDPFFDRKGAKGLRAAHAWEPARPPSALADPSEPFPPELDVVVMRALAKNPEDRYASATEFDAALSEIESALRQPAGAMVTTTFDPEFARAQLSRPRSEAKVAEAQSAEPKASGAGGARQHVRSAAATGLNGAKPGVKRVGATQPIEAKPGVGRAGRRASAQGGAPRDKTLRSAGAPAPTAAGPGTEMGHGSPETLAEGEHREQPIVSVQEREREERMPEREVASRPARPTLSAGFILLMLVVVALLVLLGAGVGMALLG